MIVALNRFISRSADRCRPFFLLLHKWKGFEWNEECAIAFQQLKEYLVQPPIMSSPDADEVLFAYIAVAPHAVSLVLIREDNGRQRQTAASLLREQITAGGRNPLSSPRKGYLGHRTGHTKASPLLSSTHCSSINSTPLKVHLAQRRLHKQNCKMGNDSGRLRH